MRNYIIIDAEVEIDIREYKDKFLAEIDDQTIIEEVDERMIPLQKFDLYDDRFEKEEIKKWIDQSSTEDVKEIFEYIKNSYHHHFFEKI